MNAERTVILEGEADTERLGRTLAPLVESGTVIGLVGPLGAGKTRLAKSLAGALGVPPEDVTSPTFVLIHEYPSDPPIAHFDVYRLETPEAFDALGPEDYYAGGFVCLIEWADRVADRLPDDTWMIRFALNDADPNRRTVRIAFGADPRASELASRFDALRTPS